MPAHHPSHSETFAAAPAVAWRRPALVIAGSILVAAYLLGFRVYDLGGSYALLGEQVRDWGIAQRQFVDLPLIGPRSVNSGLDIGPVYYWVLWAGRKLLTPVLGPLPHVGGWVVAAVQSIGDAVLLVALARAIGSWWLAAGAVVLAATSPLDASLSAVVWNPPIAEAFVKLAIAAAIWPAAATAWRTTFALLMAICAVQCHSTAIFVALPLAAATLYALLRARGLAAASGAAVCAALVVVAWAAIYSMQTTAAVPAPAEGGGALTSIGAALAHPVQRLHPLASADAVATSLEFLYTNSSTTTWLRWLLLITGLVTLITARVVLSTVSVGPPLAAIAAFSLWQGRLGDAYWMMAILPATAVCLAASLAALPQRIRTAAAFVFVALVVALQPIRERAVLRDYRQPAYGPLARGVTAAVTGGAVQDIRPAFPVPTGMDVLFMYSLAGGQLDPAANVVAMIQPNGDIVYVPTR